MQDSLDGRTIYTCCKCNTRPPDDNLALYPCGHSNLCTVCATGIFDEVLLSTQQQQRCPECSISIESLLRIFRRR